MKTIENLMVNQTSEKAITSTELAFPNQDMLLGILQAVEDDASISQRGLAQRLGVALGLVNGYLRWCAGKGLIKMQTLPPKRYAYFLTPQGFLEKSSLLGRHIQNSFALFRMAREECLTLIHEFEQKGIRNVVLVGAGDLQDFAFMIGQDSPVLFHKVKSISEITDFDALLLTDMNISQATYNKLVELFPREKIFTLPLLKVYRGGI